MSTDIDMRTADVREVTHLAGNEWHGLEAGQEFPR
jgi:hypothetical protein